jgi:hypothetical protein
MTTGPGAGTGGTVLTAGAGAGDGAGAAGGVSSVFTVTFRSGDGGVFAALVLEHAQSDSISSA